jgi:hypothetical protein
MRLAYEKFLNDPSRSHYYHVRRLLLASRSGRPRLEDLRVVSDAAVARCYRKLQRGCEELMPAWMLSPRVHYLAAVAAAGLGNDELWQLEHFQMQQCLSGLLATGTGFLENPYHCLYPTDMQDILVAVGREARAQHSVEGPQGRLDLVTCTNGVEIWFQPPELAITSPASTAPWPSQDAPGPSKLNTPSGLSGLSGW